MTTSSTPKRRGAVARDDYLRAARFAIARDGALVARVDDIARLAGSTSQTLLYHFGSKQALLAEALTQKDHRLFDRFERYALGHSGSQRLDFVLRCLLTPTPADREAWREDWIVWFQALAVALHQPEVAAACHSQEQRWCALLAEQIEQGVTGGDFTVARRDIPAAAAGISAMVDGLALRLTTPDPMLSQTSALALARAGAGAVCGRTSAI